MSSRPPAPLSPPPPVDLRTRLRELQAACEARGLPLTDQRKAVLTAVIGLDTHPTADEVFDAMKGAGSTISRATVFRTLESLTELGLVSKTCHPGRGVRFDRVNTPHHHLVCLRCNAMVDFVDPSLDTMPIPDARGHGFAVTDYRVQVRGLCRTCQEERT